MYAILLRSLLSMAIDAQLPTLFVVSTTSLVQPVPSQVASSRSSDDLVPVGYPGVVAAVKRYRVEPPVVVGVVDRQGLVRPCCAVVVGVAKGVVLVVVVRDVGPVVAVYVQGGMERGLFWSIIDCSVSTDPGRPVVSGRTSATYRRCRPCSSPSTRGAGSPTSLSSFHYRTHQCLSSVSSITAGVVHHRFR